MNRSPSFLIGAFLCFLSCAEKNLTTNQAYNKRKKKSRATAAAPELKTIIVSASFSR